MKDEIDIIPPLELITTDDERFMREALKEAKKAFLAEEVPIGAVIVKDKQVIARGYNQVEMLKDATAHAEMLAITAAANALGNWRLEGCALYCTLEPCAMCAGALLLARVDKLIWGAPDVRQGANGSWVNLFDKEHPMHTVEVKSDILKAWCEKPLKLFFQKRRVENDAKRKTNNNVPQSPYS